MLCKALSLTSKDNQKVKNSFVERIVKSTEAFVEAFVKSSKFLEFLQRTQLSQNKKRKMYHNRRETNALANSKRLALTCLAPKLFQSLFYSNRVKVTIQLDKMQILSSRIQAR